MKLYLSTTQESKFAIKGSFRNRLQQKYTNYPLTRRFRFSDMKPRFIHRFLLTGSLQKL